MAQVSGMRRSVKPNRDEIDRLRKGAGLTMEELADKTGLGLRTIQKALRGDPVDLKTVRMIANSFKVKCESLIDAPEKGRSRVRITIDIEFSEAEDDDKLMAWLRQFKSEIGTRNRIDVIGLEEGSVIVTLEMSEEDIRRLVRKLQEKGTADRLKIKKIDLPAGFGEEPEEEEKTEEDE